MAWDKCDEAIEMVEWRFRLFPHIFRWRGRLYHVETVERCWTVSRPGWRRRIVGHYFRLVCGEGTFEIFQNVETNTWHLRRVRWTASAVAAVRKVAPAWR